MLVYVQLFFFLHIHTLIQSERTQEYITMRRLFKWLGEPWGQSSFLLMSPLGQCHGYLLPHSQASVCTYGPSCWFTGDSPHKWTFNQLKNLERCPNSKDTLQFLLCRQCTVFWHCNIRERESERERAKERERMSMSTIVCWCALLVCKLFVTS